MQQNKIKLKKLHTQHSLKWSLKIGAHLGTLTRYQAIQLVNVKPAIFHRWISGKLAAPASKLERIKHRAFAKLRRKHRKAVNFTWMTEFDEELMKARFLWKNMLFDQLNMAAKRRFCARLKRIDK